MIENISLKTRILLPLALVLAILLGAFHYTMDRHQKSDTDHRFMSALQSAKIYYQRALDRRGEKLGAVLEAILRDEQETATPCSNARHHCSENCMTSTASPTFTSRMPHG